MSTSDAPPRAKTIVVEVYGSTSRPLSTTQRRGAPRRLLARRSRARIRSRVTAVDAGTAVAELIAAVAALGRPALDREARDRGERTAAARAGDRGTRGR